jgi:hypothetical protein
MDVLHRLYLTPRPHPCGLMFSWLRRFLSPSLPLSSKELTDALRAAAKLAESDSARLEYTAAADAIDRATSHAKRHGDKSVRGDVFYALGRAQVTIRDWILRTSSSWRICGASAPRTPNDWPFSSRSERPLDHATCRPM